MADRTYISTSKLSSLHIQHATVKQLFISAGTWWYPPDLVNENLLSWPNPSPHRSIHLWWHNLQNMTKIKSRLNKTCSTLMLQYQLKRMFRYYNYYHLCKYMISISRHRVMTGWCKPFLLDNTSHCHAEASVDNEITQAQLSHVTAKANFSNAVVSVFTLNYI